MNAIVDEYLSQYVAPDGGGMLDTSDQTAPFDGCTLGRTVNENPILFLVQMAWEVIVNSGLAFDYYDKFKPLFVRHMASTQVAGIPGLHSRRCGDSKYINQSHDNVVAMAIGGYLFGTPDADAILQYGLLMGWFYDVCTPNEQNAAMLIQGGDVAICMYAAKKTPEVADIIWLAGGLITSKAWNLADLRVQFLEKILPMRPQWEKMVLGLSILIHKWRRGPKTQYNGTRFGYYGDNHPFSKLVRTEV